LYGGCNRVPHICHDIQEFLCLLLAVNERKNFGICTCPSSGLNTAYLSQAIPAAHFIYCVMSLLQGAPVPRGSTRESFDWYRRTIVQFSRERDTVVRGQDQIMIPAIILTVSVAAFVQFALYYWRAVIAGIAAQPISDRIRTAAGITALQIGARDFRSIVSLHDLSPDLRGPNGSFIGVRAYYSMVEKLGSLIPPMSTWANTEMLTCSRYVAVLVDQHLERNMACAAQVRGI